MVSQDCVCVCVWNDEVTVAANGDGGSAGGRVEIKTELFGEGGSKFNRSGQALLSRRVAS